MTITDPAVSAHADATIGLFEITDHITIDSTQGAHTVEMWCPVIGDGAFQRVLDVEVTSEDPYDLTREPEFGNLMLYSRLRLATAASWSIRYVVERRAIGHAPDPARARPLATAQLFSRALIPEAHVDVDERTRTLAQDVVGPETNPLEQARRIYDYVTGAMDYDATKQSFLGSTEHALTCSVGNCNDIHALFVSLCRSVDIPARFVLGQALELPQPGAQDCEVCGYHCWAEFFVAGWVGYRRTPPVRRSTAPTACSRTCRPTTSRGRSAATSCSPHHSGRAGACSSPAPTPRLTAKHIRRNAKSVLLQ